MKKHYSSYDVLSEKDHWDKHTQEVVTSRLCELNTCNFLTNGEVNLLFVICSHLVGDQRRELISYIVLYIDQVLSSPKGEGQRKPNVPEKRKLIRDGLQSVERITKSIYECSFLNLSATKQHGILTDISEAQQISWDQSSQKSFFKKLLSLTLDAYYSHPTVWSDIGYGGPAYPRGYVRARLGQLDPWEAQSEDE